MNQQEVIDFMVNSINDDNRAFSQQAGLSESEIENNIAQSQQTLQFMMQNIYSKLVQKGIIDISKIEIAN